MLFASIQYIARHNLVTCRLWAAVGITVNINKRSFPVYCFKSSQERRISDRNLRRIYYNKNKYGQSLKSNSELGNVWGMKHEFGQQESSGMQNKLPSFNKKHKENRLKQRQKLGDTYSGCSASSWPSLCYLWMTIIFRILTFPVGRSHGWFIGCLQSIIRELVENYGVPCKVKICSALETNHHT